MLGLTEFNGSTDNNMLKTSLLASVFEDPSAPPEEQYKALEAKGFWLDRETGEEVDSEEADRCWRAEHYEGRSYSRAQGGAEGTAAWLDLAGSPDLDASA